MFKIEREALENEVEIIKVSGDLDGHSFKALQREINQALADKRVNLILDLTSVKYVTSEGAGVLIVAEAEAQKKGGDAVLLNPVKAVTRVLELLGQLNVAKVFFDRQEALQYFGGIPG